MSTYTITKRLHIRIERAFKAAELRERRPLVIEQRVVTGTNGKRCLDMAAHKPRSRT